MQVKKAIIPCAGFGTRFLPITKVLPKELLPIADEPALAYIVEEAANSGIEEVLIIISPRKKSIKKLFKSDKSLNKLLLSRDDRESYELANKDYNVRISYAVQRKMNGNGSAIYLGKKFAKGEPVAVMFGDDVMYTGEGKPVLKQLIEAYEANGNATVVGCQCPSEEIARRCGVMIAGKPLSDRVTEIKGIVEKPKGELPSKLVSLGRFVLSPAIFEAIKHTPATNGEVYLTDAINLLAKKERVCACEFDGRRYDIGNKEGYLEAVVDFALRDEKLHSDFAQYVENIK